MSAPIPFSTELLACKISELQNRKTENKAFSASSSAYDRAGSPGLRPPDLAHFFVLSCLALPVASSACCVIPLAR